MFSASYSFNEWKLMRILFCLYWLRWYLSIVSVYSGHSETVPVPIGWAKYIDLSFFSTDFYAIAVLVVALFCFFFYILGRYMTLSGVIILLIGVAVHSFDDSQGFYNYNEIINLVMLGQVLAFAYGSWLKYNNGIADVDLAERVKDLAVNNSKQMVIACYFIAGVTKLRDAGINWIIDSPNFALHIIKSHMDHYNSWLYPLFKTIGHDFAQIVFDNPNLTRTVFFCVLMLELGGFVAMINRKMSLYMGVLYLLFHAGIFFLTGIFFESFVVLVLIFLVGLYPRINKPRLT